MPLSIYSPNSNVSGAAIFVSFNSKEGSVYFKAIQQTGWNQQTKKGSFQNGAIINIKFSQDEVGGFIYALRNKGRSNFYHSFDNSSCSGSLSFYSIPPKERGKVAKEGFGFQITKDNITLKAGLSLGSAERLAQYLEFALGHIFSAIYAKDKKEAEEFAKKKQVSRPEPSVDTGEEFLNEGEDGGLHSDDEVDF